MQYHCPTCKIFVSIRTILADDAPDIDMGDGSATGYLRIINRCHRCEHEMSEHTFPINIPAPAEVEEHLRTRSTKHAITVCVVNATPFQHTTRSRKAKTQYVGVHGHLEWKCACNAGWIHGQTFTLDIKTSAMTRTLREPAEIHPFKKPTRKHRENQA